MLVEKQFGVLASSLVGTGIRPGSNRGSRDAATRVKTVSVTVHVAFLINELFR